MGDAYLEVENVSIRYSPRGRSVEAVRGVSLVVRQGEFVSIVGPSGCGKTTLLHAIGGLVPISAGTLCCAGRPIAGPGTERVLVFQEFSLFKWRTAQGNVEFALECKGTPAGERAARASHYLRKVGLEAFAGTYPQQLSGGMQQRVAIARALAYNPGLLLMDEPFGALDAQTRVIMQSLLLDIWEELRKTVLFVTHDIDEAIYLSDRVFVMTAGPGTLKDEVAIGAPRPRSTQFFFTEEFLRAKRRIFDAIQAESLRALLPTGQTAEATFP